MWRNYKGSCDIYLTWFTHTEYVVNENYLTVSRWSQIDSQRPLLVKTTVCAVILWHTLNLFLFCFLPALSTWTHWLIELDKKCPPCCVPTPKKKKIFSIINPEQKKRPWEKKGLYTHILSFSNECFVMSVCCLCVIGWVWVCVGTALCELCLLGLSCYPHAGSCEAKWKKIFQIKKTEINSKQSCGMWRLACFTPSLPLSNCIDSTVRQTFSISVCLKTRRPVLFYFQSTTKRRPTKTLLILSIPYNRCHPEADSKSQWLSRTVKKHILLFICFAFVCTKQF